MIKNPRKYWTDKVDDFLVGRTIVKVEYLPEEEVEEWMWHKHPLQFILMMVVF